MRFLRVISILALWFFSSYSQVSILVFEIPKDGVLAGNNSEITDSLIRNLQKTDRLKIIDSRLLGNINEKKNNKWDDCGNIECMLRTARMANANYTCSGNVVNEEDEIRFSVKLIDVESEKIIGIIRHVYPNDYKRLVSRELKEMTNDIFDILEQQKIIPPVSELRASLFIKSYPSMATVWIDNNKIDMPTPAYIENIIPGEHRIVVQREKFSVDSLITF